MAVTAASRPPLPRFTHAVVTSPPSGAISMFYSLPPPTKLPTQSSFVLKSHSFDRKERGGRGGVGKDPLDNEPFPFEVPSSPRKYCCKSCQGGWISNRHKFIFSELEENCAGRMWRGKGRMRDCYCSLSLHIVAHTNSEALRSERRLCGERGKERPSSSDNEAPGRLD